MPNIPCTFRLIWIDYTFIVYDYMHKIHAHILQIIYAIQCNFIHMAQFNCFSFLGTINSIITTKETDIYLNIAIIITIKTRTKSYKSTNKIMACVLSLMEICDNHMSPF